MLELLDKDFKAVDLTMLCKVRGSTVEIKERISHQMNRNYNKEPNGKCRTEKYINLDNIIHWMGLVNGMEMTEDKSQ